MNNYTYKNGNRFVFLHKTKGEKPLYITIYTKYIITVFEGLTYFCGGCIIRCIKNNYF